MASLAKSHDSETDDRSLNPSLEYDMNHKKRGMALIFNNKDFSWNLNLKSRGGTDVDKLNLISRFKELDFEVNAYDDHKRDDVLSIIKQAAAANHVDADCFVCVFLSHGENGHIFASDEKIEINEITDLFKGVNCPTLVGKPKIFILQACRGDQPDDPVAPMNVEDDERADEMDVDVGVLYTLPAGADFIMCYSVAEGYCAFRDTQNGSWYIQDLCKILSSHGSELEFTNLLTLVNREVSSRSVPYCRNLSAIGKKQMPCFASMLTKMLFFRPKK